MGRDALRERAGTGRFRLARDVSQRTLDVRSVPIADTGDLPAAPNRTLPDAP